MTAGPYFDRSRVGGTLANVRDRGVMLFARPSPTGREIRRRTTKRACTILQLCRRHDTKRNQGGGVQGMLPRSIPSAYFT